MKFRALGVSVYISLPFTALLSGMILLDKTGLLLYAFLAALVHEISHVVAMLACKVRPRSVGFYVGAVEITRPATPISKWRALMISLSGPLSNLILGLLLLGVGMLLPVHTADCALLQLATGGFNLLPVLGLDGGTAVELLTGSRRAVTILSGVTLILLVLLRLIFRPVFLDGMGMICAIVYICAMQLICAKTGG